MKLNLSSCNLCAGGPSQMPSGVNASSSRAQNDSQARSYLIMKQSRGSSERMHSDSSSRKAPRYSSAGSSSGPYGTYAIEWFVSTCLRTTSTSEVMVLLPSPCVLMSASVTRKLQAMELMPMRRLTSDQNAVCWTIGVRNTSSICFCLNPVIITNTKNQACGMQAPQTWDLIFRIPRILVAVTETEADQLVRFLR